jgi:competence protein ComGC
MEILTDIYRFLKERKKFWLVPVIIALLLIGLLIMASGSAIAPFIYTIF